MYFILVFSLNSWHILRSDYGYEEQDFSINLSSFCPLSLFVTSTSFFLTTFLSFYKIQLHALDRLEVGLLAVKMTLLRIVNTCLGPGLILRYDINNQKIHEFWHVEC